MEREIHCLFALFFLANIDFLASLNCRGLAAWPYQLLNYGLARDDRTVANKSIGFAIVPGAAGKEGNY